MFRKFTNPFLLVCWMVLSACAPALTPATATPTLTLEPTRTLTPKPTLLPTEIVLPTEVASKEIIWPAQGTETITQPEGLDFGLEFSGGC
jgi:hypothetical protein